MANNFKFTLVIDNDTEINITIHASNIDSDVSKCYWSDATQHQIITIIDNDRRKRFSFDYYGAIKASMVGNEYNALYALNSVLNDAFGYYNDDCAEAVYGLKFKDAQNVYNGCKKAYYKITRWLNNQVDLCDFCNAVSKLLEDID